MNWILGLALALIASVGVNLHQWRHCAVEQAKAAEQANTRAAAAEAAAEKSARAVETAQAQAANDIAVAFEKGKADAQAAADRVVADLRAGNLQLRKRWQGCPAGDLPRDHAAAGESDAAVESRRESAGRAIGAADTCDQQVAGLQAWAISLHARYGEERTH